jgi:hypothetical protein
MVLQLPFSWFDKIRDCGIHPNSIEPGTGLGGFFELIKGLPSLVDDLLIQILLLFPITSIDRGDLVDQSLILLNEMNEFVLAVHELAFDQLVFASLKKSHATQTLFFVSALMQVN